MQLHSAWWRLPLEVVSLSIRGLVPAYFAGFDSRNMPSFFCDVLVVGSGAAGASAALAAAGLGARVMMVSKSGLSETNTSYAQGGIAAVLSADDSVASHVNDTMRVGCGLCDEGVVRFVVGRGSVAIGRLLEWGAEFDRAEKAELALSREAGHSHARIVHAAGDRTGREIQRCLDSKLRQNVRILCREGVFVRDLMVEDGCVRGVIGHDATHGSHAIWAERVILACGGGGQIYRETTNPPTATGDGVSLAARAGAEMQDLEFVQFHPTTLYIAGAARVLISEVVRGAGGILRDRHGDRFMPTFHADAELAPRDVVSRAILHRMVDTQDTNVYLDLSGIKGDVHEMFPGISKICRAFDIDIAKDPIPVRPGAHYMIGGVKAGLDGSTSVENLYVCGELASVGLHGANRLASNSLLEGLVLGHEAGLGAAADLSGIARSLRSVDGGSRSGTIEVPRLHVEDVLYSLKALMWRSVGVERSGESLNEAIDRLDFWSHYVFRAGLRTVPSWELANMLILSRLVAEAARLRCESRGTHYRSDWPLADQLQPARHSRVHLHPDEGVVAELVPHTSQAEGVAG